MHGHGRAARTACLLSQKVERGTLADALFKSCAHAQPPGTCLWRSATQHTCAHIHNTHAHIYAHARTHKYTRAIARARTRKQYDTEALTEPLQRGSCSRSARSNTVRVPGAPSPSFSARPRTSELYRRAVSSGCCGTYTRDTGAALSERAYSLVRVSAPACCSILTIHSILALW